MSNCTLQHIYQAVGEKSEDGAAFYAELSGSFSLRDNEGSFIGMVFV